MQIIYRGKDGRFISERSAKRRKTVNVRSELRDDKGKSLGFSRGYFTSLKKLSRTVLPQLKFRPKTKPHVEPIRVHRPRRLPEPDFEPETYEELDEGDLSTLEDEWRDDFAEDFSDLDYMDSLDEYLADEEEWYED